MPNGSHALALVLPYEPEVPSEIAIGNAMAAAAAAVGQGLLDGAKTGQLDPATVANGGRAMTRLVQLQLSHFGDDFGVIARRAGRQEIERRCGRRPELGPQGPWMSCWSTSW
jgi:hypothetical protein